MRHPLLLLAAILFSLLFTACQQDGPIADGMDRPHSPWVFRSVLDEKPRILSVALHDHLWVAYHTQTGALYKAWKGGVNFDGAVYTTVHGPQPSSIGDGWMENKYESPWWVKVNGEEVDLKVQYRGHRKEDGQLWINTELLMPDGQSIQINERPEYAEDASGLVQFQRTFKTEGVPNGAEVGLQLNLSSIGLTSNVQTDGTWAVGEETERKAKGLSGFDLDGNLTLNGNGETDFSVIFTKQPLLENDNKIVGAETEEERPLGFRLIARNDCKSCHNTFVKTIGPSYVQVAEMYANTPENVAMLVGKVKNGGAGVWGQAAMTAHPELDTADIRHMIEYIMALDAETEETAVVEEKIVGDFQDASSVEGNQLLPGVIVEIQQYTTSLQRLADIKRNHPSLFSGILPNIHFDGGDFRGLESNFALLAQGYIKVPKDNNYVFRLISDDGSRLTLDGEVLIDHDGLHGARAKDGEILLKEGYHPFSLEYFNAQGGKVVSLQWKSHDDEGFAPIPPTSLVHSKATKPKTDKSPPMASVRRIPGDQYSLLASHPSYDLSQARPDDFFPKVGGMDFLPDGRMVISTWDAAGNVYILDGVQSGDPSQITAKKIADGLAEPLGLKVVEGSIYVLQKQELTQLIDHNGDEMIDEYRTVCNDWSVTGNFHEFAFGLEYKDGHFYAALAIAILPGGASANPQAPDRGKAVKINKETGAIEFFAHGLRTPNGVGIGVDEEIFIADNQGDWLPSSKILHVTKDAFFGSRAVDPEGTPSMTVKQPVVWLPQDEIGNSPSTPSYINDGPYAGQMIHGEVTHGGVKRVFVEKVDGNYQGCVFRFIQGLEAGVNRLVWGPDGALYIGGIGSTGNWRQNGKLWYGLQRLQYNEKPTFEMLAVRAMANGVEIEMTEPLPPNVGWDPAEYDIQQWYYLPTKEYGGPKMDLQSLTVNSASVSDDRKKIFLELEGMKAGHVVYVRLPSHWVSDTGEEIWTTEAWYTMNAIPEGKTGAIKTPPAPVAPNTLTEAEKADGWELLFNGVDFSGWTDFRKEEVGSSWQVQDGAITLTTATNPDGTWKVLDGGNITTEKEYENFEFQLEWKIQNCGNSGIIYLAQKGYDEPWMTGPEMQVLDNICHPDAAIIKHRAADLYDLISCEYEVVLPAGSWNKVRLIKKGDHVEHWLNGRKVVSFQMGTPEWDEMLAKSKWKDYPDFGKFRKGHICLQDHSDQVWYRNIKIKEL